MGWLVWLLFAIAGIHVFVTQLEFVFYSAAAFVTVPFATWNRTAWISEWNFWRGPQCRRRTDGALYPHECQYPGAQTRLCLPAALTQQDSVFMIATGLLLCFLQLAAHRLASGLLHGMPDPDAQ